MGEKIEKSTKVPVAIAEHNPLESSLVQMSLAGEKLYLPALSRYMKPL